MIQIAHSKKYGRAQGNTYEPGFASGAPGDFPAAARKDWVEPALGELEGSLGTVLAIELSKIAEGQGGEAGRPLAILKAFRALPPAS